MSLAVTWTAWIEIMLSPCAVYIVLAGGAPQWRVDTTVKSCQYDNPILWPAGHVSCTITSHQIEEKRDSPAATLKIVLSNSFELSSYLPPKGD
jgi:hypothetical protein